jgi:hypothetical protein
MRGNQQSTGSAELLGSGLFPSLSFECCERTQRVHGDLISVKGCRGRGLAEVARNVFYGKYCLYGKCGRSVERRNAQPAVPVPQLSRLISYEIYDHWILSRTKALA